VLLVEWALALLGVFIAFLRPTLGARWFEKVEYGLSRMANRRGVAVAAVGLSTLLLRVAVLPVERIPQPFLHDEFSYLLQSDTFAHGHLSNPTPKMWEHFETFHVIFQPTYCSKYFPGQGLFLALGQVVFGHPFWGVWLTSGLMCAGITWMLQGWFSPGWALLGGFIAMLRFGVFGYWADSYWGGNVAAIGGALVLGALPRIKSSQRLADVGLMGLGLALLANSRPWEGLILSLPVAMILLFWMLSKDKPALKVSLLRIALPLGLMLGATVGWLAYYSWRTTGNPVRAPYQVYEQTYGTVPYMIWQGMRPEPVYRHVVLRKLEIEYELGIYESYKRPVGHILRIFSACSFFLGPILVQPFLLLILALCSGFSSRQLYFTTGAVFAIFGVFALGAEFAVFYSPHYSAPVTCLILAFLLLAMGEIREWNKTGLFLTRVMPVLCVLAFGLRVAAGPLHISPSEDSTYYFYQEGSRTWPSRIDIQAELNRVPGDHLVIVRYSPQHEVHSEWVYNDADIDHARIVWARDMGASENQQLIEYFKNRKIWLAEPDTVPPRLSEYGSRSEVVTGGVRSGAEAATPTALP